MIGLKGKVAVITGGSQGIGKAVVHKLSSLGCHCMIWDIDEGKAKETMKELSANPGNIEFYKTDVAQLSQVESATEKTIMQFGTVDILINNAGITRDATLKKMTIEHWHKVIEVNLNGVFYCTRSIIPIMMDKEYGRILNASSVVGIYGNFGQSNYAATKAAVIALTKVWSRELGKYKITVNAIAPGFIETDILSTIPEKVMDMMKSKSPLNRLGSVEEVASLYAYLASEESGFISGSVFSIDGGVTL